MVHLIYLLFFDCCLSVTDSRTTSCFFLTCDLSIKYVEPARVCSGLLLKQPPAAGVAIFIQRMCPEKYFRVVVVTPPSLTNTCGNKCQRSHQNTPTHSDSHDEKRRQKFGVNVRSEPETSCRHGSGELPENIGLTSSTESGVNQLRLPPDSTQKSAFLNFRGRGVLVGMTGCPSTPGPGVSGY